MKTIGIQIDGDEAILVVLQKNTDGSITQSEQSTKLRINDHTNSEQVKQFRDQVVATLNTIDADKIGVIARVASANARMKASPVSFKLEGIIQLYPSKEITFVWPQTVTAYFKKNATSLSPKFQYQLPAFQLALMLLNK